MSLIAELKQVLYDLPLANKPSRTEVAHFCEHDGIHIEFTRARTTWHAMAPSAVKPWWMIIEPIMNKETNPGSDDSDPNKTNNKKQSAVEVYEDA